MIDYHSAAIVPSVTLRDMVVRQMSITIAKVASEFGPSPSANQLDILQRLFAVQDYLQSEVVA